MYLEKFVAQEKQKTKQKLIVNSEIQISINLTSIENQIFQQNDQ